MSSSFADSFDDSVAHTESDPPFEEDADSDTYGDYDSQQLDSSAGGNGDVGGGLDGEFDGSNGPILPPPSEMANEEGFALREWRRLNGIRLEEKEKREKEVLSQILEEAEEFKVEFHRKREVTCENNKAANREKEKLSVAIREKFHADADKNYWKAIAELIPNELPTIEKRGKKDQEKKPSIAVIQGPKPGKPTELSRMRQILIKLKHDSPAHLKLSPAPAPSKDAKSSDAAVTADSVKSAAVVATPEAVAVAVA